MGENDNDLSRRTFVKAAGLTATAGTLGVGATSPALADEAGEIDPRFTNIRVREAAKVWDRGYRGRSDRTIGLTDTGVDARHPDLGPWNGVVALIEGGEVKLTTREQVEARESEIVEETPTATGTLDPGTTVEGSHEVAAEFEIPEGADFIDATLEWEPDDPDRNTLNFRIDLRRDDEWYRAAFSYGDSPIELEEVGVDPGVECRYVVENYVVTEPTDYEVTGEFGAYTNDVAEIDDSAVFRGANGTGPSNAGTPKTVGWYTDGSYGGFTRPLDGNGHGTHVSSIMAGSGRASAIDPESFAYEEPNMEVPGSESYTFEYDVEEGEGLYIAATGTNISVAIQDEAGIELASSGATTAPFDHNIAEARAQQSGTHRCVVETGAGGGTIERVGAGTFLDHERTAGDRTDGDTLGLHSGLAPDMGVFGMQGLGLATEVMGGEDADGDSVAQQLSEAFNLRSVNMSWSYLPPNGAGLTTPPYGALGGELSNAEYMQRTIERMAEGGVLAVAAASNSFTAGQTSVPALAPESISVAATTTNDGLTEYTSGGLVMVDADGEDDPQVKPDVCAPGGTLVTGHVAAENGSPDPRVRDQTPLGYTGKAGTSMASPYVNGVVGLVSQAMEEDGPEPIRLPEPAQTTYDDAMRLKQAVLATATTTAFTAAPFHRGNQPTYTFGEPDIYEGYGRVNPDAAVDAVSRDLTEDPVEGATIGLDVPDDSRAVAGYVELEDGSFDASVTLQGMEGDDATTAPQPHIDLFVYDAENPEQGGQPNMVAGAPGADVIPSVTVDAGGADGDVFYVVAKLVNVPGHVNGDDVRAVVDLTVDT